MPQLALFEGINASGQYGLWATDGTTANTLELTGIAGASVNGLSPTDMTVFNGEVLFNGVDASGQNGLWVTNGTAAGTYELTGITCANTNGIVPYNLTVFNGVVLFEGTDTNGQYGLWVTDGTTAGTHELTGIVGANTVEAALGSSPCRQHRLARRRRCPAAHCPSGRRGLIRVLQIPRNVVPSRSSSADFYARSMA